MRAGTDIHQHMRDGIIGIIIGVVIGVAAGATVIAPRLNTVIPAPGAGDNEQAIHGRPAVDRALRRNPPAQADASGVTARPVIAAPKTDWRMASAFAADLAQLGTQAKRLETEIWKASAGAFRIAFFPPETLAPRAETLQAVKAGAIEAAFITPDQWPASAPALQLIGGAPFGPGTVEYLGWLYFGGGEKLLAETARKQGVEAMVCGLTGAEGAGWFKTPVSITEDIKGLKMRISGLGGKVLDRLGVETVELPALNLLAALEAGELDAAEFSLPSADLALGLNAAARYYYFPGWHQPVTALTLIINPGAWKALGSLERERLRRVCGDNVRYGVAQGAAAQTKALLEMTKTGTLIGRWPPALLRNLKAAWVKLADAERAADADFKRVWSSLDAFRKDYAIWRELRDPPR